MAAKAAETQAKLDKAKAERQAKAAARRAKKAKETEAAAAATGGASTGGGDGSSEKGEGPTMPEGLSAKERVKWKREHPGYVDSSKGKGGKPKPKPKPKGKSVVSSAELDKDMPEDVRNGSKLDQLKWRKKQAALVDR